MKLKNIVLASLLLVSVPAFAAEKVLALHLECLKPSLGVFGCTKFAQTEPPGATFSAQRTPSMTLGPADVVSAQKSVDPATSQQVLSLHLTEEAGKKFAHITKTHVKKHLAIVLDREVLTAPVIQTEIQGGNLQITAAVGKDLEFLDKLPWLKKLTEAPAAK